MNIYDKHALYRKCRITHKPRPWLNDSIISLMKQRDSALRKFKRNKTVAAFEKYRVLRNKVKQMFRNAKYNHTSKLLDINLPSHALWKNIISLGICNSSKHANLSDFDVDKLNSDFSEIPYKSNILDKIHYISFIENINLNHNFPKFKINPVSLSAVKSAYRRIKSLAKGNDNISIKLINPIISYILPALTNIINQCILSSVFPDAWKCGLVFPLPKIKNPTDSNDLRPICILSLFSKVLEHLVIDQLDQYLEEYNLIYQYQSGFRKQHSTTTSLIKISDDIKLAKDNHEITFMILLDFSKAFNCIDFDILAIKMFKYFNFSDDAVSFL
jgi:hypothetical protein